MILKIFSAKYLAFLGNSKYGSYFWIITLVTQAVTLSQRVKEM
jgi:hypothetical protein